MRLTDDPATTALVIRQLGVISRRQLLAQGWPAPVVDGAVRRGRLEVLHRGVYRIPGSAQPPGQAAMAAVLRAGRGARVTGAPVLQQLRDPAVARGAPALTLLPPPRCLRTTPVLWRPDLAPDDDSRLLGPVPATTPARAFVEVAASWSPRRRLTVADHLRWDRLATTDAIVGCAQRLGPHHDGARAVLDLIAAGHLDQESHGERDLAASLTRLGLRPLLRWQVHLAVDIRVDCLLGIAKAVLEYDGEHHHSDARDLAADARRERRIHELDHRVVRITKHDLRDDDALRAKLEQELGIDVAQLSQLAASHQPPAVRSATHG
jgi:very-short-patch-repair endonuclease